MSGQSGSFRRHLHLLHTVLIAAVALGMHMFFLPAASNQNMALANFGPPPTLSCSAGGTGPNIVVTKPTYAGGTLLYIHTTAAVTNCGTTYPSSWYGPIVASNCTITGPQTGFTFGYRWDNGTDEYSVGPITCPPGTTPPSGGATSAGPVYNDPPGTGPRLWSLRQVIYLQPYGLQFYHYTGQVIGLVDLNQVGIPGPGGMITSMSFGDLRIDLFYHMGDQLRSVLYEAGVQMEEAFFTVDGIGARAGEVAGMPVPGAGGTAGVPLGSGQIICRQNLRQYASIESARIDILEPGTMVDIMGRSNDGTWLNVYTPDDLTGWVFNGRCVNVGASGLQQSQVSASFAGQPTVNTNPAPIPQNGPRINVTCNVNLRVGPGNDFPVERVLHGGTSLVVVGRDAEVFWLQVATSTGSGWVYFGGCVVPESGDITSVPVAVDFGG